MDAIISVLNLNFSGDGKEFTNSFSSRRTSRKSVTLTIHWNLTQLVKSYLGIIVHQRLTVPKQMLLLKERCAESRKEPQQYCHNLVCMCNGGLIPWNVIVSSEMFRPHIGPLDEMQPGGFLVCVWKTPRSPSAARNNLVMKLWLHLC